MKKITKQLLATSLTTTVLLSQAVIVESPVVSAVENSNSAVLNDNVVYQLQLTGSGWTKEDAESFFTTYVQKEVQITEYQGKKVIAISISGDSPFDPDNVFYAGSQVAELSSDKKTAYIPVSAINNHQVDIDFDVTSVDYSTKHLRGQLTFKTEDNNVEEKVSTETVSEENTSVVSPSSDKMESKGPLFFEAVGHRASDYQEYFNKYIVTSVEPIKVNGETVIPVTIQSDTVIFDEGSLFYGSENKEPQLSEDKKIAYVPVSEFKNNQVMIDFRLAVPDEYGTFIRGNLSYDLTNIQSDKEENTIQKESSLTIEIPQTTLQASAGFSVDVWQNVIIKDNDKIVPRSELSKSYITIIENDKTLSKEQADKLIVSPQEGQYQVVYHVEKDGQVQEKTVPFIVSPSHITYDKTADKPLTDGVYTMTAKAYRIDSPENESILLNFFDPRVKLEVENGEYTVTFLNTGLGKSVIDFSLSVPTYKNYNNNALADSYYPRNKETIKRVNSEEFNTYKFKLDSIEDIRQVGVLYTHRGGIEELVGHYDRYKMAFLTFDLEDIKQGWYGFKEEESTKNGEAVLQNALVKSGLDLNDNGFVTADELAKAQGEVDLSNYQLSDVAFLKHLGAGVTTLKLMNNNITVLPDDFFDSMINLENVYLNHNSLTTLPTSLSKLSRLQVFKAPYNTISLIAPEIFEGSRETLQEIELENNFLTAIPESTFANLTKVDTIDLSNNHLASLGQQSFLNTKKLSYLNLNNNRLTTLPQTISQAPQLRTLNINGNLLETLDLTQLQTPELQNLTVNGNVITNLVTGKQVGLSKLKTFDVSSNLLTSFDETPFKSLTDIISLDVALNPFTQQTIVGDRIISPVVSSSIEGEAKDGQIYWHVTGLTPADYVLWSRASSRLKPIVDKTAYEQYLANQNMSATEVLTESGHNFDTLVRLEKQQSDGKFVILEEKQVKQQNLTEGLFNDAAMKPQDIYRITVQSRSLILGEYQPRAVLATLLTSTATPQENIKQIGTATVTVFKPQSQELSTMNKFIEPTINIVEINGQKFAQMTIKNASWWQEFKVDGKDVAAISENSQNDTRVIQFVLSNDKTVYPSNVHVVAKVPGFAYDHHYDVQLQVDRAHSTTEEIVRPEEDKTEEIISGAFVSPLENPDLPVYQGDLSSHKNAVIKMKEPSSYRQVKKDTNATEIATEVTTNDEKILNKVNKTQPLSHTTVKKERTLPKTGIMQSSNFAAALLAFIASALLFLKPRRK